MSAATQEMSMEWAERYLRESRGMWGQSSQRAIELVLQSLDQCRVKLLEVPAQPPVVLASEAEFHTWPDCCRRTLNWSRRPPRLFRCSTCGEVMHTKIDVGALHHQRLTPGADIYITHRFRHFDASDTSDFGMYLGEEIEANRGAPHWPHYELKEAS